MGENTKIFRGFFDALMKGDIEAASGYLSPDLVVHVPGRNPLSGDHKGPQAFFALFGSIMEKTGGTFRPELHDVTESDDHVVGLFNISAERGGKRYAYRHAVVTHIEAGKIREEWPSESDQYAVDEMLA